MAKYTQVEFIEWIENSPPNSENAVDVTSSENYDINHTHTVIPTLDKLSAEGWDVVSFTDTFFYLESDKCRRLQRRRCYLLKKEVN